MDEKETPEVEIFEDDPEWQMEDVVGETLDPDDPEVLAARREAGDPTVPEA